MKLLIVGGTGLLGTVVADTARQLGWEVVTSGSRTGDVQTDLRDLDGLANMLDAQAPDVLVNAAALVSLAACEEKPGLAWEVNARPAAVMATWSARHNSRFVQVSTDHFFSGSGFNAHSEEAPVTLVNEYARTKYAAEALAMTNPQSIVVRTTFVGRHATQGRASFFDWILDSLETRSPMTLFADAWFSPIEVRQLARAILELAQSDVTGVMNVAGRDVVSKEQFIRAVARYSGHSLENATIGSVAGLVPSRGDSLGLDVSRAEDTLGRCLPTLEETVSALFH